MQAAAVSVLLLDPLLVDGGGTEGGVYCYHWRAFLPILEVLKPQTLNPKPYSVNSDLHRRISSQCLDLRRWRAETRRCRE